MITGREMARLSLVEIVRGWVVICLWWKVQKICHTARLVKSCSVVSYRQLLLLGYKYLYSKIRHQSNHKNFCIVCLLLTTTLDQGLNIDRKSAGHSLWSADFVLKQLTWIPNTVDRADDQCWDSFINDGDIFSGLIFECVTFSGKRKKGGNDNNKW